MPSNSALQPTGTAAPAWWVLQYRVWFQRLSAGPLGRPWIGTPPDPVESFSFSTGSRSAARAPLKSRRHAVPTIANGDRHRSSYHSAMALSQKEQIRAKALQIIESQPTGIRYSQLVKQIHEALADIPVNTIRGNIWNLEAKLPDQVLKPARGVYLAPKYSEAPTSPPTAQPLELPAETIAEEHFYEPFAEWLTNELEECTKAVALGGNRFKDKWGTPDIIGIREPRKSDIIKPPTEIVAAELKIDRAGLIVAFGQACAYKLFAHRSYIVVPSESLEEDIARLDVLCRTLGVGLILFDSANPSNPEFQIRVRAARHEPDMFYVNKYMRLVEDELFT